jgi:hypothetical protein
MMSRNRVHIIVVGVLLFAGVIGYIIFGPGVHVTVRNTGQVVMRDVTVHVTGRAYSLGDLAAGGLRTQKVSPTGKSHVEVEFTDEQGKRVRLDADCYFSPDFRGQIDIHIKDGKVVAVQNEVRISTY